MLEARLQQADTLKKIIDAVKELVNDINLDCSDEGMKLQAMDNAHVCLIEVSLSRSGFDDGYRCDRSVSLGLNLTSLQKVFRAASSNDEVTLSHGSGDNAADVLSIVFESKGQARISEYEMRLMDIDREYLTIPDTVYDAEVTMPAAEFTRIIHDLREVSESVRIGVTKDGIRFESRGDIGNASVTLRPSDSHGEDDDDDDDEPTRIVEDQGPADEEEDQKPNLFHDEDEDDSSNKRSAPLTKRPVKKPKVSAKGVSIVLQQSVELSCSLKHLGKMTKSAAISDTVIIRMSGNIPMMVEYKFDAGVIQYHLAPKIND